MDCHLVSIKIRVESGADERMKLDRLSFHQYRLERLDAEAVQRRSTVQHHRVLLDHILKDVPHLRIKSLNQLLRILDILGDSALFQFLHDERLEQLDCHFLRQTALVNLQLRPVDNNGASGVVNTLAQQILTEASILALQHVRQGLQRTVAGSRHRAASSSIINQRVHRLLQHSLLIADDDFRRAELKQSLQAVVAVDNAAVQIIEVGRCEPSAVQLDHRTQIRRNDRHIVQNHPARLVSGLMESLDDFKSLDQTGFLLSRCLGDLLLKIDILLLNIDAHQQFLDRLGAHPGAEVILRICLQLLILRLRQNLLLAERYHLRLTAVCLLAVIRHHDACAGIKHDVIGKIQNLLEVLRGEIQNQAHPARNSLEIPDVRYRRCQGNMSHSLAAHAGLGHLNATAVADDTLIPNLLVLAAMALPVLAGSEDFLAEQAVFLRLECAVIDRLRLCHLSV